MITEATIITAVNVVAILISRIVSHYEHKSTDRNVMEIKLTLNGALEKRLVEHGEVEFAKGEKAERDRSVMAEADFAKGVKSETDKTKLP